MPQEQSYFLPYSKKKHCNKKEGVKALVVMAANYKTCPGLVSCPLIRGRIHVNGHADPSPVTSKAPTVM